MNEPGNPFDEPLNYLRENEPDGVAESAGVAYSEGKFDVAFLRWRILLTYPEMSFEMPGFLDTFTIKLLTLLYLMRADGAPPANQWVPYRELPDGLFYSKSFSETVEDRLRDRFASDVPALLEAGNTLGATAVSQGDAGLFFTTFPRVNLLVIFWQAEDEFPASANILFDAAASHYLNVFELRMLASEVVTRLIGIANGKLSI